MSEEIKPGAVGVFAHYFFVVSHMEHHQDQKRRNNAVKNGGVKKSFDRVKTQKGNQKSDYGRGDDNAVKFLCLSETFI